jgi:hypothetical protein
MFVIIILASSLCIRAQDDNHYNLPIDKETGLITFTHVDTAASISKDLIYSRAKIWIANYYKSAKAVINMDDKESGILKIKALNIQPRMRKGFLFEHYTFYDLYIYIKEGKFKSVINSMAISPAFKDQAPPQQGRPVELILLFSKDDKKEMRQYESRKEIAEDLRQMANNIFTSLSRAVSTESNFDF